ncbi:hypothetical protein HPB50_016648 [Hyalomma asiaticum]|uniref:Uncharacterized protein n=1 Tax=Hyalomma asiaticum TaxID=266040 RepID=A0ACB7TNR7_HYAAI|nr:hypothetical protein HPB50_016648 [Hyalomma asiaticum]
MLQREASFLSSQKGKEPEALETATVSCQRYNVVEEIKKRARRQGGTACSHSDTERKRQKAWRDKLSEGEKEEGSGTECRAPAKKKAPGARYLEPLLSSRALLLIRRSPSFFRCSSAIQAESDRNGPKDVLALSSTSGPPGRSVLGFSLASSSARRAYGRPATTSTPDGLSSSHALSTPPPTSQRAKAKWMIRTVRPALTDRTKI